MKYREIRKYQTTSLTTEFIICPYCQLFSPFFTKYFIKRGTIPNIVTVYMILSGLLGAVLFAVPNLFCQILGAVFIHLWFILDCSDGEVARITKTFSTFGKELDYTAHVINHPFFSISFFFAMYFSGNYNITYCLIALLLLTMLETWSRHLCSFEDIYGLKLPSKDEPAEPLPKKQQIITFIYNSLMVYPNFALIFPLCYFLDLALGTQLGFGLLLIYALVNLLLIPKQVYGWVKRIVRA